MWSSQDYPEGGPQLFPVVYLTSSITYKASKPGINSKENKLDLFASKESRVYICMYEGAKLGIIPNTWVDPTSRARAAKMESDNPPSPPYTSRQIRKLIFGM